MDMIYRLLDKWFVFGLSFLNSVPQKFNLRRQFYASNSAVIIWLYEKPVRELEDPEDNKLLCFKKHLLNQAEYYIIDLCLSNLWEIPISIKVALNIRQALLKADLSLPIYKCTFTSFMKNCYPSKFPSTHQNTEKSTLNCSVTK